MKLEARSRDESAESGAAQCGDRAPSLALRLSCPPQPWRRRIYRAVAAAAKADAPGDFAFNSGTKKSPPSHRVAASRSDFGKGLGQCIPANLRKIQSDSK